MNSNLLQTIKLQQLASNPKNSAWVFASAGSGKTKILTDRVLRLLLEDVAPHKILCLTFTKVAAAEMQSRINSELAEWILCDDLKLEKKLTELSGNFPSDLDLKKARTLFVKILDEDSKIKVQTIHAFCQTLIKIFPFEAKVKPNFELLEENQEKLLLRDAQKEVFKKAQENQFLQNLIKKISSKLHEESLSELILELLGKKEKIIFLKENFFGINGAIDEIYKLLELSKNENEAEIFQQFLAKLEKEKILKLAFDLENSGSSKNVDVGIKIKNFIKNPAIENLTNYKLAFFTLENAPRKIYGKTDHLLDLMDEQRELIAVLIEKLNSLKIANDSILLLQFIDQILENYSQLKKQKSLLDYNDLIIETNRLLANPDFSNWVKMKMDSSFDHILIDESQDTNHQQWNIIKALSEDFFSGLSASTQARSIFIVGDEKQSIFSFQGSDANISAEIFAYFDQKLGAQLKKIELNNSFRSTKEILQAVDKVFSDPKRKNAISKVSEFQEHKAIRLGRGLVEIWPLVINETIKTEENHDWKIDFSQDEEQKEKEILAELIAKKIKSSVENSRILEPQNRSVKYGDFMILLRNRTNGFLEELVRFFHQYKIPFTSISRIRFSESLLIQDLLAAAKFVLLPQDDLNLACLLKSPIFAISEEELLEICLKKNAAQTTIYQSLEGSELRKKLDELILKSSQLNVFEFFYFLLHQENHQQNFLAAFGHESLQILDKFILAVSDFCRNFSPNLQKFLEFVEKIDPQILLIDDEENRVKITTIHSSKGLQAPIVMLPDCAYDFKRLPSSKEKISWINDLPLWCTKKSDENEILKIHREAKFEQAKEEYLRLLYVAMTRPQDELYIGGFGKSSDVDSWYEIVKNSLPENLVSEEKFRAEENFIFNSSKIELAEKPKINPYQKPFATPVKSSESQINPSQIRGRLIHKILEIFGKNSTQEKTWLLSLAQKIIAKEEFLDQAQKNEVSDLINVFMVSAQFEEIFCGDVKCEVEIIADKIFGRIDLLIEKENEILIVDYKSDESLLEVVPASYLDQLKTYEKLVRKNYPQKKISCAILWVRFLKMEFVNRS